MFSALSAKDVKNSFCVRNIVLVNEQEDIYVMIWSIVVKNFSA